MKTKSAKAKGRRLQQWVAKKISEITGIKHGKDERIESREMGQSGVDIKLYAEAKEMFPFSVECKNAERWQLDKWITQAKENQVDGTDWVLIMKKNGVKPVVCFDAEVFFDLYEQGLKLCGFDV